MPAARLLLGLALALGAAADSTDAELGFASDVALPAQEGRRLQAGGRGGRGGRGNGRGQVRLASPRRFGRAGSPQLTRCPVLAPLFCSLPGKGARGAGDLLLGQV